MSDQQVVPSTRLSEATEALRSLRLAEAVAAYSAVPDDSPEAYDAHLGLARAYTRMRRQDEATRQVLRCIEMAPDRAQGYAALGALQFLTDDIPGARASLERAEALDSADPEAPLTLAQVAADAGDFETAMEALRRGREKIAAIPAEPERVAAEAVAWHVETYVRMAQNDVAGATNAAQETLARRDANPYAACLALSNLGILAARARRYDEGIDYFEQAYALNPYFGRAGSALGRLLLVRRQYPHAAEVLRDVIDRSPSAGADTYYAYAFALARSGQRAEAHAAYGQALAHGITGMSRVSALWQRIWLSEVGRYVVIGIVLIAILVWVLAGRPSPQTLTLFAVLAVVLLLQRLVRR